MSDNGYSGKTYVVALAKLDRKFKAQIYSQAQINLVYAL
ncbi:hypothetical protein ATCC51561_1963 [Campylobacter concisus ATCC 51561]|nr:hypothetical protein ATCC51561_1963 [Campylobacter concisus ATCC 51561]